MPTVFHRSVQIRALLAGFLFAITAPLALHAASGARTSALRFTIEDAPDLDVTSDGLGDYVDFRLLSDPDDTGDINYCMESQVSPITFLFFNRSVDAPGGSGSMICDDSIARRQFYLHIERAAACTELMANNYGWPDGGTGCYMHGYRNPRIRIDKLFASRPRTTPIDFLIGRNPDLNPPEAPTYRIESDREATIDANGDTRSIVYGFSSGQTFHLVKVDGTSTKGKGATPTWALPFTMTLRMTFTLQGARP